MQRLSLRSILPLFAFALLGFQTNVRAEVESAAEFFPKSSIFYAEVADPNGIVEAVLSHPLYAKLKSLPEYKAKITEPEYKQFLMILGFVEGKLGMGWQEAAATLTQGGVHLAFDPVTNGAAAAIKAKDADSLEHLRTVIFELVRNEATRKGDPDPISEHDYRGMKAWHVGELRMATLGPWLILVNNSEMGKSVLDRHLDGGESLADHANFQAAKNLLKSQPTGWAWVDLETVRKSGEAEAVFNKKSDNPAAELLLGGLSGTLRQTPFLIATLDFTNDRLALSMKTPHKAEWVDPTREYFLGPEGHAVAPPLLQLEGTLLSLSAYRDFSQMWLRSSDLFVDKIDAGFGEANATLSTLFGGKDFGEDILGAFTPDFRLISTRQTFSADRPVPSIKLPSFAAVMQFRDGAASRQEYKRMYQNLIGFLNIVGAMEGNPQMNLSTEKLGEDEVLSARFFADDRENEQAASIHFNFSPSVAFVGNYFVVSSTEGLAKSLAQNLGDASQANSGTSNSQLKIDFPALGTVLEDNKSHLVASNALEEGRTEQEAEYHIGLMLQGLSLLKDFRYHLDTSETEASIGLEIRFQEN